MHCQIRQRDRLRRVQLSSSADTPSVLQECLVICQSAPSPTCLSHIGLVRAVQRLDKQCKALLWTLRSMRFIDIPL